MDTNKHLAHRSQNKDNFPTFSLGLKLLNEAEKEKKNGKGDSASALSRFASLSEGEMQQILTGPNKSTEERPTSNETKNYIKIAHLNVRSLKNRGHFVQVKDIVTSHNFDIFTISETWLDHIVSNLKIETPRYDVYRIDRRNKRGGVVCAYVRQIFNSD